ncbi:MAG: phosphoglucosamine mutase [Candidatus Bilamarchaeaceae archaeon]
MARYFGTNGARGTLSELPPDVVLKLARATGLFFKRGKILIARDGRITSELYRHAVISGLLSAGCHIVDLGMCPSPTAEFMIKRLGADGLVIITASHNPPEYNGIKIVDGNGVALSKERAEEIEKLMDAPTVEWNEIGRFDIYKSTVEDYINELMRHADNKKIAKRKPKLVLDCGNGMAALVAPQLFKQLGCEAVLLNAQVDGRFPGRPSEPTEQNVQEMLSMVKSVGADAGIAWDGDADRVAFADERGRYIIGDKVFALSALLRFKEKKGNIATTVATSLAIEDIARRFGARVVHTKIGAPYLSEEVAKGAVIGGEEVGGVIWPEISLAKEGIYTAAKIVEAICDRPLSEWLKEIPEYINIKEKIPADEKKKKELVDRVKRYAKENKLDFIDIDGVRINYPNSWVIVRAAGTENYVRVFAEAKTEKEARELIEKYKKILLTEPA